MRDVATIPTPYYDPTCPYDDIPENKLGPHPVRFETATPLTSQEKWYCRVCKDHFLVVYE